MAKLAWGKPKIEITESTAGAPANNATWKELPTPEQGTFVLETSEGDKKEAIIEGGDVIATLKAKNKYTVKFSIFLQEEFITSGAISHEGLVLLADNDGVITKQFAIRVTPEDDTVSGFVMNCCSVSVITSFSSEKGMMLEYTFDGLKPASGAILQRYKKAAG